LDNTNVKVTFIIDRQRWGKTGSELWHLDLKETGCPTLREEHSRAPASHFAIEMHTGRNDSNLCASDTTRWDSYSQAAPTNGLKTVHELPGFLRAGGLGCEIPRRISLYAI